MRHAVRYLSFWGDSFVKPVNLRLAKDALWLVSRNQHPWQPQIHRRGVKSKASTKSQDLPQGALHFEETGRDTVQDGPSYPTVVQQARNNMRKFENCVLLTRVGGFYEV
jgi:hypothetical protein